MISRKRVVMVVYVALVGVDLSACSRRCPAASCPAQDKQYLVGFAQLPDGATLDRTEEVIRRMGDIALKQPGVESAVAFPGLSINGFTNSSNCRHRVRDAEAVRGAQGAEPQRQAPSPASSTASSPRSRKPSSPCSRRRRCGPRHHRRLQAADRGSRRARLRGAGRRHQGVHRQGLDRRRNWPGCSPATRSTCRSSMPISTAPRRASSACP